MNLRTLAKHARSVHRAVSGGRAQVQQLRDASEMALGMFDAIEGLTGHIAKNPSVGSLAGTAAAFASRFIPQAAPPAQAPVAQQARPVQTRTRPQAPKRVTVEVIDAEIINEPIRKSK